MSENPTLICVQVLERHENMASTTIAPSPIGTASFPAAQVEAKLRAELVAAIKLEASLRGYKLPKNAADIAKASVQVDSLVVVALLCRVEPIVGFELKDSVVRAGGYSSVEQAVGQLLPKLEKEWQKKSGAKP